jgi:hypothetical protein
MKICRVGEEYRQTDEQTNIMKLTVAFRNFAKAANKLTEVSQ